MTNYKILEYVRSKGQSTAGLKPIEAIKEQLNSENYGRKSSFVEKATTVKIKLVEIKKITISADKYYERIEELEPRSKNKSEIIAGVVFYDKQLESYRLIDGYHRTKFLKNRNVEKFQYIVLSE